METKKKQRKEVEKRKSITAKPLGIKPYAPSVNVAPIVSNKKNNKEDGFSSL